MFAGWFGRARNADYIIRMSMDEVRQVLLQHQADKGLIPADVMFYTRKGYIERERSTGQDVLVIPLYRGVNPGD